MEQRTTPGLHVILLLALLLIGCETSAPTEPGIDAPRVDEVQSRLPPPRADPVDAGVQTRIALLRVDLLDRQSTANAWSMIQQRGVEPAIAQVWRGNGLRAAVIHRTLLPPLMDLLPKPIGSRRLSVLTSMTPTPIDFTPSTQEPYTVQLTLAGGGKTNVQLPPGSTRIMIATEPADDEDDVITVTLTPHHHWLKPSVKPRTRIEQELDGRSFDLLQLTTRLRRDELLLIGVPPPPELAPAPAEPDVKTEDKPDLIEPILAPQPPPPPLKLGRLILQGVKHGQEVQMLLVIGIE